VANATEIIAQLAARGETVAIAESLTGGLLVAELIQPAGASAVVLGGVVAYNTELKSSLLDVDPALLARHGPVHADVAAAMARNVRTRLAVDGIPATFGLATTGVAGPDSQGGQPPGVVYVGLSCGDDTRARRFELSGSRDEIRTQTVHCALGWLSETLERGLDENRE